MNDSEFTDDDMALMDFVADRTLDRSRERRRCPRVLGALLQFYQEDELAQLMGVSQPTISNWKCGIARIKSKHYRRLYLLLEITVKRLQEKIDYLKDSNLWTENSNNYLQYRLGNAKGALTVRKRYY